MDVFKQVTGGPSEEFSRGRIVKRLKQKDTRCFAYEQLIKAETPESEVGRARYWSGYTAYGLDDELSEKYSFQTSMGR